MIEARSQNNLPLGVMVNRTAVTPSKSNRVPVTLVNTNSYNVWIKQQLLAADIVEVDHCLWDYHSTMSRDGSEVQVMFRPVPTPDVQADIFSVDATKTEKEAREVETTNRVEQEERPNLGLDPSSTRRTLILIRNWHDSLFQLILEKWNYRHRSRNVS